MLSGTNFKGQLVSKDETKIILENNRSVQTILKEEIHEVKVVKFSILKSSGLVVAVAAVFTVLFANSIIAGANSGGWLL